MKSKPPKKLTKAWLAVAQMPPLKHSNSEPFDIMKSQVAEWLSAQPAIRQSLFNRATHLGVILFDQDTQLWEGISHKSP